MSNRESRKVKKMTSEQYALWLAKTKRCNTFRAKAERTRAFFTKSTVNA